MINVVGTMFFKDKKLLLDKPRRRPTFQMLLIAQDTDYGIPRCEGGAGK